MRKKTFIKVKRRLLFVYLVLNPVKYKDIKHHTFCSLRSLILQGLATMTGSTCLICTDFTTDALPDAAVPFIRAWDGHRENTSLQIPEDELWFQTKDLSSGCDFVARGCSSCS